jgi:uncharacterized protein
MTPIARWCVLFGFAALLGGCGWFATPDTHDLYTAQTFVTGKSEESVAPQLAKCLADVLLKLSGDPAVASDPALAAYAGQLRGFVTGMSYRDYMEGIPIGDEQGTRDRPYFVKIGFAPDKVDAVLRALGRTPWTSARPRIVAIIGVRNHARDYVLTSDGPWGADQRDALADAAWAMGLTSALPTNATPGVGTLTFDKIAGAGPAALSAIAASASDGVPLVGTLAWADGAKGWAADFRLDHQGKTYRWGAKTESFDEAFRVAMRGALQILSGHGAPG